MLLRHQIRFIWHIPRESRVPLIPRPPTLGENGSVDSTDTILIENLVNSKLQNLTIFLYLITKSCHSKPPLLWTLGDFCGQSS